MRLFLLLALSLVITPLSSNSGQVNVAAFKEYSSYISVTPPEQIIEFSHRHPDFIKKLKQSKNTKPLIYEDIKDTLQSVNDIGNQNITWKTDQEVWGAGDVWEFPCESSGKLYEDCDGIALWKLKKLVDAGIPATNLIFTFVYAENGMGHAVIVVVTDNDEYVLDNRRKNIVTVQEDINSGYQFVSRPKDGNNIAGTWIQYPYIQPKSQPNSSIINAKSPNAPLCVIPKKVS